MTAAGADRMASSDWRLFARTSRRFATLKQPMSRTNATPADELYRETVVRFERRLKKRNTFSICAAPRRIQNS